MTKFDLHFHSTYSDGKLLISELVEIIKEKKLEYCALTDHNTVAGVYELITALAHSPAKVIPATEITAKYNDNEIHILAYDFDIDAAAEILSERDEILRREKIEEMEVAIKLARLAGLEVKDDLKPLEKQPVALTVAFDICASSINQDKFLEEFDKNLVPEDIYYIYQAPGKSCAVKRSGVSVEWVVQKFKGVARDLIIAHPYVSVSVAVKPLNEAEIDNLLELGLTGIEVYHNKTSDEQIEFLKTKVLNKAVNYTGGSDFHGRINDTPIGQYNSQTPVPDFELLNYRS